MKLFYNHKKAPRRAFNILCKDQVQVGCWYFFLDGRGVSEVGLWRKMGSDFAVTAVVPTVV